ncbi:MAG TPA: L-threonylcarbamoyladenylate synthase [Dehalococcoidia bacterium]|nr:L-threonylcarbamoyladenylate synthase [Dehalococcoidia bacterium]
MRILIWAQHQSEAIAAATECLRQGGLVAFPTDTLYGLGADIANDSAVTRLFQAKRRPPDAPIPILISGIQEARAVAKSMPVLALKLGNMYWPGPLTMVLERSPGCHSLALAGGDSVALRVPDHAIALAVIHGLGRAITGTSANRSGQVAPRTATDVVRQLEDEVDIVIDGGPCPLGVESTVVDLRGKTPRLLREGAVSREELEGVFGFPLEVAEK